MRPRMLPRILEPEVMDTPEDPFRGGTLRADADAGLLVVDGAIAERGPYADVTGSRRTVP